MRTTPLTLLIALSVLLAACSPGGQSGDTDKQPASSSAAQAPDNAITGNVGLQPGAASSQGVSAGAKLELSLEDISQQPSVPIARKTIQPLG
ncbi:MAG: hypothetical protein WBW92_06310, partial [Rhodanobacteraceae bacterium]